MSLVTPYINKMRDIKRAIPRVAGRAILENAEIIIEVLRKNQLSKGLDASGAVVGTYSEGTQDYLDDPQKRPRNTNKNPGDPYNFEWFGTFYDSLNLKVNANTNTFEIFSTATEGGKRYDVYLEDIFNSDLTTLMKDNEQFVMDTFVQPYLIEYLNTEIAKL